MGAHVKTSEECLNDFRQLRAEITPYPLKSQTEADTRARIISKILHEALDWPQQNVTREEAAHPGFMDYVLSTNKRAAVVEAKKSGDTFALPEDINTGKNFTLSGIVRKVKNLSEYIDQALGYVSVTGNQEHGKHVHCLPQITHRRRFQEKPHPLPIIEDGVSD
jgi:hypothetical protein